MVLIRNNVQKESTYGWYPSQVNIYENPRATQGYDKECLFRHWQSGLHHSNPDGVASVTPAGFRGSMKTTSRSRSSKASISRSPAQVPALMLQGSRPGSLSQTHHAAPPQFIFERSRPSSRAQHHIPTPEINRGYHGWQPQPTIIGIVDPTGPFIAPSPQLEVAKEDDSVHIQTPMVNDHIKELTATVARQLTSRPQTPAQTISGSFRAQSASLNRPRVTPTRPVKSAGSRSHVTQATSPVLLSVTGKSPSKNIFKSSKLDSHRGSKSPSNTYWAQVRNENPTPPQLDDEERELERPPTPVNLRSETPIEPEYPTYEEQLDKYGWLAEIPGDPLNLKIITERLPYTFKCAEPVVGEYPFKTRVTVGDTFFSNTIPKKPMTFAVHPEWQSENFVAKRKELEKKGRKFHTRDFGFAY